ncbi:MAG TPA: hypothetical protein VM076_05415 [Gemmatimonadaceae bacterium]|nr:hypothetical protein [Gemmatimonadaceae bacterium]
MTVPSSPSLGRVSRAAVLLFLTAACSRSATTLPVPSSHPDRRVGLKPGLHDAGEAIWNLGKLSTTPSPEGFAGVTNSDLAFSGKYAIQGNYNGFMIYDMSNPRRPQLVKSYLCPASQSDVSVYRNLLFVSAEGLTGRTDCGTQGVADTVSKERVRGIRVFDITDVANPRYVTNVQTCRGSHTHTVVEDPKDKENVYIYVSGSAGVRSPSELAGCSALSPDEDPSSALFRIEVIRVPLARPQDARIVSSPRIFEGLNAPPGRTEPLDSAAEARAAARAAEPAATNNRGQGMRGGGPTQCHDITVYPAAGLAGGACRGYGLLLDISDVANPVRLDAASDSNFAAWHSATFSNDGTKILFTDEWGGGRSPRCRATDNPEWGADAIFTIENRKLKFHSYYKLPAPQTALENCVAHNGSLIPIPGREVMVQAWYQGGISIFDWTDPAKPFELAYHDRGPSDSTKVGAGGSWSAYWYNGQIVSSEIARGLDVFELHPSEFISQNEIDAAKTVHFAELNTQGQPKMVWPPSFALARAYVDQLERKKCLTPDRIASVRQSLASAERASASQRQSALSTLSTQLSSDAQNACDGGKLRKLLDSVRDLSAVS